MKNMILCLLSLSLISATGCNSGSTDQASSLKKEVQKNHDIKMPMNELTDDEKNEGWVLLFDGNTTNGWRGFKKESFPDKGWHVVDQTLMIEYSGAGEAGYAGDIITEDQFENFDLKLDWKISPGGNSGILLHVNEYEEYPATWNTAHEIQVIDEFGYEAVHDYVMTIKQISGAYYDMVSPLRAASYPQGEWNEARIRMEEGHLQHWLNGTLVIDTQLWTPEWKALLAKSKFTAYPDFGIAKKGHIGLQDHGQQVWYRNIRIREL